MESTQLADVFEKLVHQYRVPGAQLALYDNGELRTVEVGHQHHDRPSPVTRNSAFPFGSVTKFVTATLAMQFVSDGDIDLDTPISEYVPALRGAANPQIGRITPRQLLSHTGGLVTEIDFPDMRTASYQRYAQAAAGVDNIFPPGEAFSYSNVGYCLVGHLVERVSGMDWWTAVETCLLRPLGITPAFLFDPRPLSERSSVVGGHTVRVETGDVAAVDLFLPLSASAAGGLAGSASDLVTLARLQLEDRDGFDHADLLPDDAARNMRATAHGAEPFGLADAWGLGLMKYQGADGTTWFGHDGTVDGTSCHLRANAEQNTALAMTANGTTGLLLWADLVESLRDAGIAVGHYTVPATNPVEVADPADYTGDYVNGNIPFRVESDPEGGLALTRTDGFHVRLAMHQDDVFLAREEDFDAADIGGRFVRDAATGAVTLLQYGGRSYRRS
ncbi:serine hydrolase domain-containing protein [Actinoalloteichus spitiensis]|uniref:serine hydrolase domain-containing protein n=1 Tax=Actinoalloteichus spitiensis TaxID=252394 RepID=UPI000474B80B|nr:serine hydrolase domain-containing protein [Actinoalloteichus spitiensis]